MAIGKWNYRLAAGACALSLFIAAGVSAQPIKSVKVGEYEQQFAGRFTAIEGAPKEAATIAIAPDGSVYAAGGPGLFKGTAKSFAAEPSAGAGATHVLASSAESVFFVSEKQIFRLTGNEARRVWDLPESSAEARQVRGLAVIEKPIPRALIATPVGLFAAIRRDFIAVETLNSMLGEDKSLATVAATPGGKIAVGGAAGLFISDDQETWSRVFPRDGGRSWAPADVRAVAFDGAGRLWFASPQGVGRYDFGPAKWDLFSGADGLPYDDFTSLAPGRGDEVWFGTKIGAIRFDGKNWEYRQGKTWLPGDEVRAIAIDAAGAAWFATSGGVGRIEPRKVTLAAKAKFFEDQADKYHRRTPYEYVDSVSLTDPGNPDGGFKQRDSDNDGLWTSMYGAGECFAWAATKDPKARERAVKAFKALQFLGKVTQGGEHSPPPGYVARTILPIDGPDPNIGRLDQDRREQAEGDKLWKVIDPRWPKSADGKWYWKCDTSSDELDGHYFFYAAYYDLVAESEEEKAEVRAMVTGLTDHLIAHDFNLVDHDGKPTRWARFSPKEMNHSKDWWEERGLNSLSMLSYLRVAEHMSGDAKYGKIARSLMDEHGYKMNVMTPKQQMGPGTGNQSDDEMAFMGFYNLMRYEKDPELKQLWALSFHRYWVLEYPERNPLFNFMYAAVIGETAYHDAFGRMDLSPIEGWLDDSLDTLQRYPWDRVDWGKKNSHRKDIIPTGGGRGRRGQRGTRMDGKVLPVDERVLDHWNHDPWHLDHGGQGRELLVPTSFLLPYYMGLHYGFLKE